MKNSVKKFEKRFIELVKRSRIEKGLTQSGLAKVTGLSSQAISNFERGASNLSLQNLIKIFIGIGKEDLLESIFPEDYTSPRLQAKIEKLKDKNNLQRVSRKSEESMKRIRELDKALTNPFEGVLGKKDTTEDKE